MKILVTGGAGFIGSHLVDRLAHDPANDVIVLDNFSRGRVENLETVHRDVQVLKGDIRDRADVQKAMEGVDVVYHLAAQSNVLGAERDLDYSFETNVAGTYNVLRAADAARARRVIFSSSREVYGEPTSLPVPETTPFAPKNAYGVSKVAGELYCRLFAGAGLDTIVFRLANVYGTRDLDRVIPLFAEQSLEGKDLTVFGPGKTLDFLWIGNLVDVLLKASTCRCPESPVNLGSGKGVTLATLAERISKYAAMGSTVKITEERAPEVGRFVADVSLARQLFELKCPEDPLEHVPLVVESIRSEILNRKTASESSYQ